MDGLLVSVKHVIAPNQKWPKNAKNAAVDLRGVLMSAVKIGWRGSLLSLPYSALCSQSFLQDESIHFLLVMPLRRRRRKKMPGTIISKDM